MTTEIRQPIARCRLQAEDVAWLQVAYRAGTPRQAIADALGLNLRSVYRYAHARIVWATIEGWRMPFIIWRPGARPMMLDTRSGRALRPPATEERHVRPE